MGVANNFGCFFLSGLPGGIDYVLLVLVRYLSWGLGFHIQGLTRQQVREGLLHPAKEKYWMAMINLWLRGPPMCM